MHFLARNEPKMNLFKIKKLQNPQPAAGAAFFLRFWALNATLVVCMRCIGDTVVDVKGSLLDL